MDAFETIVSPRRVTHRYRFTRFFFRSTWTLWRALGRHLSSGKRREAFLSWFGPLSMLTLFATWAIGLILGFGLLHWSLGTALRLPEGKTDLHVYFYLSGVTFFTLGFGDVTPREPFGQFLTVAEAGIGFGFMAVIIGYLPVLYQAFSQREVPIAMMDARASSPPSAAQVLLRLAQAHQLAAVNSFLAEWERWAAELLESHLSFPVLSYYRSQHDNQSWLAALTAVLDTCALLIAGVKDFNPYQAEFTFATARHAAVDLALVFRTPPQPVEPDRFPEGQAQRLCDALREVGVVMRHSPAADARLAELRAMYEPFVNALAQFFLFTLPPVWPEKAIVDNWQTSAWTRRTPGIGGLPGVAPGEEHFG
jgi:hypothetical protein